MRALRLRLPPRRGWNCYATPTFSGVPNAKHRDQIRSGYLTPAFSGAQKRSELRCNPYILGVPQRQARGQNQKWLPHPYLLGGLEEGGSAMYNKRNKISTRETCAGDSTVGGIVTFFVKIHGIAMG